MNDRIFFYAGLLLIVGIAGFSAFSLYQSPRVFVIAAVVAAVTWLFVSFAQKRVRAHVAFLIFTVTFYVVLVPLAAPQLLRRALGDPLHVITAILAAPVTGWKQLLTSDLPAGSYYAALVPYTIVLVAAALGYALNFGSKRIKAAIFWLWLPLLFSALFGSGRSPVNPANHDSTFTINHAHSTILWLVGASVTVAWCWLFDSQVRLRALARGRKITGAARLCGSTAVSFVLIAALSAAGTIAVTAQLPERQRYSLRDSVERPVTIAGHDNLLVGYRKTKNNSFLEKPIFSVETLRGVPAERVRIAVFDEYTGSEFRVSQKTAFNRVTGGFLQKLTADSEMRITIKSDYLGVWLPHSGELTAAPKFYSGHNHTLETTLYRAPDLGAVLAIDASGADPEFRGLRAGDNYVFKASIVDPPKLAEGSRGLDFKTDDYPEMQRWIKSQQVTADIPGLETLFDRLRARGYLSHALTLESDNSLWLNKISGLEFTAAPGGHSRSRIEKLFSQLNDKQQQAAGLSATSIDNAQLVAAIGDDEQFAVAAALLARALGYNSRVVVGARLAQNEPGVPACAGGVCLGENIAVWVEVQDAAGNWAIHDVSPQTLNRPLQARTGVRLPEFNTVPQPQELQQAQPELNPGSKGAKDNQKDAENGVARAAVMTFFKSVLHYTGLLLALLAVALAIPAIKFLRLRYRASYRGSNRLRALYAWQELLDRAQDAGVIDSAQRIMPRALVAKRIGSAGAKIVAENANAAAFAPLSRYQAEFTAECADKAWQALLADLQTRRKILSRRQRICEHYRSASLARLFRMLLYSKRNKYCSG